MFFLRPRCIENNQSTYRHNNDYVDLKAYTRCCAPRVHADARYAPAYTTAEDGIRKCVSGTHVFQRAIPSANTYSIRRLLSHNRAIQMAWGGKLGIRMHQLEQVPEQYMFVRCEETTLQEILAI